MQNDINGQGVWNVRGGECPGRFLLLIEGLNLPQSAGDEIYTANP